MNNDPKTNGLFSQASNAKNILPFLALLFFGFLIYSNVLHGEFVSDDHIYITSNLVIRDITDLRAIWVSFNTRFLPGLTFSLNYTIGRLDEFGYHVVNILIHVFASFLVFQFVRLTFQTPALKNASLTKQSGSIAILSSLIFLSHPIQTQAVSFITQRISAMSTLCYLLVLTFYILARLRRRKIYYIAAIGSLIIGLFCKENIVTVPVAVCVYEFFFFPKEGKGWREKYRLALPLFLSWILFAIIFLQDRPEAAISLSGEIAARTVNWNYFFTEINVLRTFLRLLILPVHQIHDYDYPIAQGFWETSTLYSFFLLTFLLGLAYYLFTRKRIISFCILWFFITTSVEFMVVSVVNKHVIFEHWLYLPMVGFSFFLSYATHSLFKSRARMRVAMALLILILASATYQRNKVWKNEIQFWQDALKKSPNKPAPHFAMGRALDQRGFEDLAIQEYHRTLAINPQANRALNNLGGVYLKRGYYEKAIELFKRILAHNTEFPKAYNNIAYVYYLKGDCQAAIPYYEESLARQLPYPDGYFYMGQCYWKLGDEKKARESLIKAFHLYRKYKEPQKAEDAKTLIKSIQ